MGMIKIPEYPEKTHFVYAMLCQDRGGPLYIKFGLSSNIGSRLSSLRVSCPIPARYFAIINVATKRQQRDLERALHKTFSARKITGEWYKFDASSQEDKREYNDGTAAALFRVLGAGHYFEKISVAQLDSLVADRRAAYFANKREIDKRSRAEQAQRSAWRELRSYGVTV